MSRFVAFQKTALPRSSQVVLDHARTKDWRFIDISENVQMALQNLPLQRLCHAGGEVLLIGEVVGRIDLRAMDATAPALICSALSQRLWGRYIALLFDHQGALQGVFRDPSGALDCIVWKPQGGWVVANDTPPWLLDAAAQRPDVSWRAIGGILKDPSSLSTAHLLVGARTVSPGGFARPDGSEQRIWSPGQIVRTGRPLDAAGLKRVIDDTVTGLTHDRRAVLVEVSGGLDSAIMASSLKASGFPRKTVLLNVHGPYAESDERLYAAAVAEKLGDALTIRERRVADLVSGLSYEHPRTPRPNLNRMDAAYDALQAELCATHKLDGVLTGKGGDVAFIQTASSTILADQIRGEGLTALTRPTAAVLARRMRRSVWRVMQAGCLAAARPRSIMTLGNSLIHPDIMEAPAVTHPWFEDLEEVPAGKRIQIAGFAGNLSLHSASRRTEHARLLHPALSQQVMEACLATPVYSLTLGGHDRLLARTAFADRLPELILQRRSKGELGAYYGQVVAANLEPLRAHLLEGLLARQGLIDRVQVEAALQIDHLIWQGGYVELMMLALVESWCRGWT